MPSLVQPLCPTTKPLTQSHIINLENQARETRKKAQNYYEEEKKASKSIKSRSSSRARKNEHADNHLEIKRKGTRIPKPILKSENLTGKNSKAEENM